MKTLGTIIKGVAIGTIGAIVGVVIYGIGWFTGMISGGAAVYGAMKGDSEDQDSCAFVGAKVVHETLESELKD